jgi:hypothetical protein
VHQAQRHLPGLNLLVVVNLGGREEGATAVVAEVVACNQQPGWVHCCLQVLCFASCQDMTNLTACPRHRAVAAQVQANFSWTPARANGCSPAQVAPPCLHAAHQHSSHR